jgi:leucyl/phenylalanyl-tRNA--protein transferase
MKHRRKNELPVLLGEELWFPDPMAYDAEGLVAVGGDLRIERLKLAYGSGIFPWTVNPVTWWSPDPRGIIELGGFHVSRSLARTARRGAFRLTRNQCFRQVMEACAQPGPGREETWISGEFVEAYTALHEAGSAHSIECWSGDQLAGGVYGVAVGGFFAAESMFHRVTDASKTALLGLVETLRDAGFRWMDIQMITPATRQFGAIEIPRRDYLASLSAALNSPARFPAV